jgi:hypothetical protein
MSDVERFPTDSKPCPGPSRVAENHYAMSGGKEQTAVETASDRGLSSQIVVDTSGRNLHQWYMKRRILVEPAQAEKRGWRKGGRNLESGARASRVPCHRRFLNHGQVYDASAASVAAMPSRPVGRSTVCSCWYMCSLPEPLGRVEQVYAGILAEVLAAAYDGAYTPCGSARVSMRSLREVGNRTVPRAIKSE